MEEEKDLLTAETTPTKRPFKEVWCGISKKKRITLISVVSTVLVVLIVASVVLCLFFVQPNYKVDLAAVKKDSNIIFSDEFNDASINDEYWRIQDVTGTDEDGNPTYYDVGGAYHTKEAVVEENGRLNINIAYNTERQQWECGGVHSKDPGYFKYGYIEIKATLADFGGCWSTFWLCPKYFGPDCTADCNKWGAEIDIVESPLHPNDRIQQAIHKGGWGSNHRSLPNLKYATTKAGENIYKQDNTYGLYWNEEIYIFFINGEPVWTTSYYRNVSQIEEGINMTIGTIGGVGQNNHGLKSWAGGNSLDDRLLTDKSVYSIDYVRVYKVYEDDVNKTGKIGVL